MNVSLSKHDEQSSLCHFLVCLAVLIQLSQLSPIALEEAVESLVSIADFYNDRDDTQHTPQLDTKLIKGKISTIQTRENLIAFDY